MYLFIGTGKTLVARALANECSQDDRRVAFYMRKGADCLSKWVGESERQLRLLFDQVLWFFSLVVGFPLLNAFTILLFFPEIGIYFKFLFLPFSCLCDRIFPEKGILYITKL